MVDLIEFPADDLERARRFWRRLLGAQLEGRREGEGTGRPRLACLLRRRRPGRSARRVADLGGEVIHPGERWATCRDSEGSPFGLVRATTV